MSAVVTVDRRLLPLFEVFTRLPEASALEEVVEYVGDRLALLEGFALLAANDRGALPTDRAPLDRAFAEQLRVIRSLLEAAVAQHELVEAAHLEGGAA